jgi:hypothetical protein
MTLAGNNARIFLDGVDLSAVTSTLNVETTVGEYDATTLVSTVTESRPGLNQGTITIDGFFDGVLPGQQEAALYDALGASNKIVAALFDYKVLPAPAYVIDNASNMGLTWSSPSDGLITINGSFKGKLGVKRGKITHYRTTRNAVGLTTGVQIPGVLTSSQGKAFLFFHSYTGSLTGSLTANLQTSATGAGGWGTEANFSLSALGAQSRSFTTPLGPYFALDITSLGGATSVVISLILVVDNVT